MGVPVPGAVNDHPPVYGLSHRFCGRSAFAALRLSEKKTAILSAVFTF